jgi:hypothetical protein
VVSSIERGGLLWTAHVQILSLLLNIQKARFIIINISSEVLGPDFCADPQIYEQPVKLTQIQLKEALSMRQKPPQFLRWSPIFQNTEDKGSGSKNNKGKGSTRLNCLQPMTSEMLNLVQRTH